MDPPKEVMLTSVPCFPARAVELPGAGALPRTTADSTGHRARLVAFLCTLPRKLLGLRLHDCWSAQIRCAMQRSAVGQSVRVAWALADGSITLIESAGGGEVEGGVCLSGAGLSGCARLPVMWPCSGVLSRCCCVPGYDAVISWCCLFNSWPGSSPTATLVDMRLMRDTFRSFAAA